MKQLLYIITLGVVLFLLQACGTTSGSTKGNSSLNLKDPTNWPEKTTDKLGFKAESPLYKADGTFRKWVFGKINMPSDDITRLNAVVYIDINSVYERTIRLTQDLKTEQYLDGTNYPIAKATIRDVSLIEGDRYKAKVDLELKGTTQELETEFVLTKNGNTPHVKGDMVIARQDFKVGTDKMKSIKNEVIVYYDTDLK